MRRQEMFASRGLPNHAHGLRQRFGPQERSWRTLADLPAGATVLAVWAHPDDEAFVAAGTLAAAVERGCRVVCVYATRGEQGWQGPPEQAPADIGAARSAELAAALAALGVDERWCLDYPDGELADVPFPVAVTRMLTVLDEVRPDVVVTFGPDGFTGHPDHMAVSAWVTAALHHLHAPAALRYCAFTDGWVSRFAPALNEFDAFWPGYPVVTPVRDVAWSRTLETHLLDRKIAALRAHHSQTARLFTAFGEPFMRAMAATEWFTDPRLASAKVTPWVPARSRNDLSGSATGSPLHPATACWRSAAAGDSPSG